MRLYEYRKGTKRCIKRACKKKGMKVLNESAGMEKEDAIIALSKDRISKDPLTAAITIKNNGDKTVIITDEE